MKTNRYLLRLLLSSLSLALFLFSLLSRCFSRPFFEVSLSLSLAHTDVIGLSTRLVSDVNKFDSISIRVHIDQTDDDDDIHVVGNNRARVFMLRHSSHHSTHRGRKSHCPLRVLQRQTSLDTIE